MSLLEINLQYRVIIGISAMVFLFSSFLIAFIANQRKKLKYHKELQALHGQQQQALMQQNSLLEQRVNERTSELLQQKETLLTALTDLKVSQLQLVQKEKMASLGELTAGIAHEIQNPLNFVNNFSELNAELLMEMKEKLAGENLSNDAKENINSLIEDVTQNHHKILHHGRRADSIVKSMLQHSRSQSGEMQPTDLNALADEYVKLSYHGFRAKDKSFNCTIKTVFDENLDMVNMIPQDIGRVLINLYYNAFYSVNEKKKIYGNDYDPVVSVITERTGNKARLTVADNGIGISQKIIDKIYQPFFTTKPTGEGTGLGLSLSYDIIKAHQGELKVESKEGEFAEFAIELAY
jgi:two-component system, NtrC family, sensor kinase